MDVVLLHNAGAGDEDHPKAKLLKLLKRHGFAARYAEINAGVADPELLERADMVVVAGGDGTVRKAVLALAGTKQTLAILPLGTANNIARSLKIGDDLEHTVASWKKARTRKLDVGVASGPWGKQRFVEGLGFGLIGRTIDVLTELDESSEQESSTLDDKLHRDVCVLGAIAHEMAPVKAKLTAAHEKTKGEFLLVEVLNIRRAGPGIEWASAGNPMDGWLDVVHVFADERRRLLRRIVGHLRGAKTSVKLHARKAKKVRLVVDPCELRMDDKILLHRKDFHDLPHRRAKISIEIEPGALSILA